MPGMADEDRKNASESDSESHGVVTPLHLPTANSD